MASRVLWKGSISFGLVHIPVALHSATSDNAIDFDWLDKRSMDPIGYKRINKKTVEEIDKENVVKGIAYEDGQYVILTDEEISAAYPKITQTIEIESFVANTEIPFVFLERPYYIEPINKGQKVYALLRDTLLQMQRVGVARVVIQTKQHLAVLVPSGPGLVLNLLRWGADIRPWDELSLPPEGAKASGLTEREQVMAKQLVDDMTDKWDPARFTDSFKDEIMALVKRKVAEGKTETVLQPEVEKAAHSQSGARILDLTDLLQRSLRQTGASTNPTANRQTTRKASPQKVAKGSTKKTGKTTTSKTSVQRTA